MSKGKELFEAATGVPANDRSSVVAELADELTRRLAEGCEKRGLEIRGYMLVVAATDEDDEWFTDSVSGTRASSFRGHINANTTLITKAAQKVEDNIDLVAKQWYDNEED